MKVGKKTVYEDDEYIIEKEHVRGDPLPSFKLYEKRSLPGADLPVVTYTGSYPTEGMARIQILNLRKWDEEFGGE